MLVPFRRIKNLAVLTHLVLNIEETQLCKLVSVTYISVKLHLVKCTNLSLIQVISLTEHCITEINKQSPFCFDKILF